MGTNPTIYDIISRTTTVSVPKEFMSFETKLRDFLTYTKLLSAYEKEEEQIQAYSTVFDYPAFLGVEVEVENIHKSISLPTFWKSTEDGSLRNGGVEFVSEPLRPKQALQATVALWLFMKRLSSKNPDFSWRSSIHDHLSILELHEDEFRRLLLLCFLLEDILFAFAGEDRRESMFCVPLTESVTFDLLSSYIRGKKKFQDFATQWPKYTAINLCRVYEYQSLQGPKPAIGTIEFRHLGGTTDVRRVLLWHTIILQIMKASIVISDTALEERVMTLNTSSKFMDFLMEIFSPEVLARLDFVDDFNAVFTNTVCRAKEFFVKEPKLGPTTASSALLSFVKKQPAPVEKAKVSVKKVPSYF